LLLKNITIRPEYIKSKHAGLYILQPGLELEGLGLCQGLLCLALQPLSLPAGCGCMGGLLQGSGISGQIAGFLQEGMTAVARGGAVHGKWFYGIYL
jgi:hypothetical protein